MKLKVESLKVSWYTQYSIPGGSEVDERDRRIRVHGQGALGGGELLVQVAVVEVGQNTAEAAGTRCGRCGRD